MSKFFREFGSPALFLIVVVLRLIPAFATAQSRKPNVIYFLVDNLGMGVEFQQIRRGDRPLLDYVLSKLKSRRVEEFSRSESVGQQLAAVSAI